MADPKHGDGNAARLKRYWAFEPEGRNQWVNAEHKWTTLNRLLKSKGVPKHMVDGLTTNIYKLALGKNPNSD